MTVSLSDSSFTFSTYRWNDHLDLDNEVLIILWGTSILSNMESYVTPSQVRRLILKDRRSGENFVDWFNDLGRRAQWGVVLSLDEGTCPKDIPRDVDMDGWKMTKTGSEVLRKISVLWDPDHEYDPNDGVMRLKYLKDED